ncbi:hypothetical protein BaRGS_00033071 [Batillaria attramentaria]|uniref:C2H2-type domain-containing protein n=1 Tax=Batillaria attramentaria TaxID=370345 RepID=A0ABD0JL65_9CAEN
MVCTDYSVHPLYVTGIMDNELARNTYTTESSLRKDQNLTDHEYADCREMKKEGDVKTENDAAGAYGLTPNRLVVGSGHKKRYQCSICNALFSQSWNCISHMQAHTRVRPDFNCEADKMNERHVRDENGTHEPVPTLHADGRSEGSTPFDFTQKVLKSAANQSSHNGDIVTRTTKTDLQRQSPALSEVSVTSSAAPLTSFDIPMAIAETRKLADQAPIGTDTGMSQAENPVIVTMENSTAEVMSEARDSAQEVINIRPEESATTSVPMDLTALFEELSASIQSQATGKKAPTEFGQVLSAPTGPVTITVSLPSARVSAGEKITIPIEQLLAATSELQQQDQSATSDQVINIHIVRDSEETANLTTFHSNKQHILLQPDADGQICIQAANNLEPALLAENGLSQNASGNDQKPQKEKLWPCDICGVRFSRNWYLTVHRRTHFRQTSFPCDVCGVEFPRVGNLNRHRRVHTGEKPFPCSNCDATFSTKYRLIEHLRRHAGIKLYKCDVCGGGFTDSSGLRRHKRSHKGDNLPFTCEVCGAGFNTSHSLTTHLRSHSGEEGCEGPGIELDAKEPTALKMPVITAEKAKEEGTPNTPCVLVHTDPASGTSSYKCSECPRSFKFAAACRQHIMHHTGSRPFKCRHCGAKFARKADAKRHTVIHTRRKSHECSKCGEQFLSKAKLALHAEDHLDLSEKTHKCDLCPKVFSTPSVLRSHHKMHSRKDSLKHDANLHKDGDSISEKRTVNTKVCDQPQNGVCVRISVDFAASTDKTETRAADELSGEKNGACAVNISPVADPLAFMTEQHHVVEEINAIQAEEALKQTKGKKKRKRASSDWEDETETKISAPTKQTSDPVPRRRPQRQASKKLQQLIAAVMS